MKCSMCENKKMLKAERRTIKFDSSGLDNVTLVNVPVYTCDVCGEVYEEIPRPKKLMTAIARALVFKKGVLTPKEVVFLRKFLGYSRRQLSALLDYNYESLNRIETGNAQNPVSDHFDRTMRILVCLELKCPSYDLLDAIENGKLVSTKRISFEPEEDGWRAMPVAA